TDIRHAISAESTHDPLRQTMTTRLVQGRGRGRLGQTGTTSIGTMSRTGMTHTAAARTLGGTLGGTVSAETSTLPAGRVESAKERASLDEDSIGQCGIAILLNSAIAKCISVVPPVQCAQEGAGYMSARSVEGTPASEAGWKDATSLCLAALAQACETTGPDGNLTRCTEVARSLVVEGSLDDILHYLRQPLTDVVCVPSILTVLDAAIHAATDRDTASSTLKSTLKKTTRPVSARKPALPLPVSPSRVIKELTALIRRVVASPDRHSLHYRSLLADSLNIMLQLVANFPSCVVRLTDSTSNFVPSVLIPFVSGQRGEEEGGKGERERVVRTASRLRSGNPTPVPSMPRGAIAPISAESQGHVPTEIRTRRMRIPSRNGLSLTMTTPVDVSMLSQAGPSLPMPLPVMQFDNPRIDTRGTDLGALDTMRVNSLGYTSTAGGDRERESVYGQTPAPSALGQTYTQRMANTSAHVDWLKDTPGDARILETVISILYHVSGLQTSDDRAAVCLSRNSTVVKGLVTLLRTGSESLDMGQGYGGAPVVHACRRVRFWPVSLALGLRRHCVGLLARVCVSTSPQHLDI
ncbi:hypothetical protein KIPB_009561, partial [Kipferlia bialata]